MRVRIISPPLAESALHGPHLAAPMLAAILRARDIDAEHLDLNIREIRALAAPSRLECALEAIQERCHPEVSADVCRLLEVGPDRYAAAGSTALMDTLGRVARTLRGVPPSLGALLAEERRAYHGPHLPEAWREVERGLLELHVEASLAGGPDQIGFSVAFGEQLPPTLALASAIRGESPATRILLGGSQISLLTEAQLEALAATGLFDCIVAGDGEETILEAVAEPPAASRSRCRLIRSRPLSPSVLEGLPAPVFTGLEHYLGPLILPVLATKGCHWGRCRFCDYSRLSNLGGHRYLARPPEEVLDELAAHPPEIARGMRLLVSDAVPPGWYRRLASLALARGIELRSYSYMTHSPRLDHELLALLSRAGVRVVNFGTESLSPGVLRRMGKPSTPEIIRRNIMDAKRAGLRVIVNTMVGYPGTTRDEARSELDGLRRLAPFMDDLNPQRFVLTEGTELARSREPRLAPGEPVLTSHGLHGLRMEDPKTPGPDQVDRLLTEQRCLGVAIRARGRARRSRPGRLAPDTVLQLDETAAAQAGPPRLRIPSLGVWCSLAPHLLEPVQRLLARPDRRWRAQEVEALLGGEPDWLEALLRWGLVVPGPETERSGEPAGTERAQ